MDTQPQKNLIFPISTWEFKRLEKGAVATPHWHDVVEKDDTFCAIVGLKIEEAKYGYLRERGIHCLSCEINDEALKNINKGDITLASYSVYGGTKIIIMLMMDYRAKGITEFPNNVMPQK